MNVEPVTWFWMLGGLFTVLLAWREIREEVKK